MAKITKVVRVPVLIADEDKAIRLIKYRALDKVMYEARFLANMAIRYTIALRLEGIPGEINPETGKPVALDTRIYRIVRPNRKYLQTGIVSSICRNYAGRAVKNIDRDAWAGRKSLPTFRSIFVPFHKQGTRIQPVDRNDLPQFLIEPSGFGHIWLPDELVTELAGPDAPHMEKARKKLRLISNFSWKDTGAREVVSRIVSGRYELCDSQIQKGDKGLMLFLSYKFEPEKPALDPARVCGIDQGVVVPAVCAVNFGPQRAYLGRGQDVWAARSKFRAERRRNQQRRGMYSKTRRWERSAKEDHWIQTYYHTLTRQVIKFCLQHNCGTIHVEDLVSLRREDVKSEYRRLLWVPGKFLEMLGYKAEEAGITLVKANPRNTSRRCSQCGHISAANRTSQRDFICEKCGDPKSPVHADYNAARNLALAAGDVIKFGYVDDSPGPPDDDSLREESREA